MKIAKELWSYLRVPLIIAASVIVLLVLITNIVPAIQDKLAENSPIQSITAENDKIYSQTQKIKLADFAIKAKHKNGKSSRIKSNEIKISKNLPDPVGKYTSIRVELKSDPSIACVVKVKNKRDKKFEIECGSPKKSAVKAVLYSNGELAFEGNGDVMTYNSSEFPWKKTDNVDIESIKAVSFEKTVTPSNLDNWFSSMSSLVYVGKIPDSVESISSAFANCVNLTTAPELSNCKELLDVSYAYQGCTSLETIPAIPESVTNAEGMCSEATSLQVAPDMSNAENLENAACMFMGCSSLTETNSAPAIVSAASMYKECINLKEAPQFTNTVLDLSSTFFGDVSLIKGADIPASARDISQCYSGCKKLRGKIAVNANPKSYSSFLSNAVTSTKLDLTGSSTMLEQIHLTSSENRNITINGVYPENKGNAVYW